MYEIRNRQRLRDALIKAGVIGRNGELSKAELARRLTLRMGKRAPSRQYLSRILQDDGDPTTSRETAIALAAVANKRVDWLFRPPRKSGRVAS